MKNEHSCKENIFIPDARRSTLLFSFKAVTAFEWPLRTPIRFPLRTENSTMVVSSEPLNTIASSGVTVRHRTAPRCSLERKMDSS